MSAELIRRNTQTSRLEYLFNLLQDGNNDIGTLQEDDISTPQEDDNNEYDTAAAGGTSGVITVQQQTTTANDSIEKSSDELDHDEVEDAELRRQWDELLKLSLGFLKCEVRSYGDLDLIDLAKLAIDYEVPRDHNSDDMYHYRPFIIECLENQYCENRANICVELLNDENEVHRKLIPLVIGKSSKDGDLLSVFYSLRSTLGCINSIYRVPQQPTREDVDTSIETSVTDVLSTPASDIDSREEEGTDDLQVSVDTSFEDETIDERDNINVLIESTAPSSLEGGGDNVMGVDVDFTNSGGDIDMMDVNALGASQHLEGKAMEGPPVETVDTSPTTTNEAVIDITTESQQREDLSILTVVQLKDRLRGLNLAVGGRKQELIDRLNTHLYPPPVQVSNVTSEEKALGKRKQQLEDYSDESYDTEECTSHLDTSNYPFTATITNGRPNQFQLGYNDKGVLYISRSAEIKPFDRRMLESLKDIVKQTGERMLAIVQNANLLLDPSSPFFNIIPRNFEKDAIRQLAVYGKFVCVQGVWILHKVGAACDLLDRSTADEYEEFIIRCLIHVDGISGAAYDGIAVELNKMIDWILDPSNKVEEPVRRLFLVLKESGALSYSFGRQMIVQLLETAVTYRMREHQIKFNDRSSLVALNEFAYYPLKMHQGMTKEVEIAMEAIMNHPQLMDLFITPHLFRRIALLTWDTGCSGRRLSSKKVMVEQCAGFEFFGDQLPALFPDSTDPEEMFCEDYTDIHLDEGRIVGVNFLDMLCDCGSRGEYVIALFNRYTKLRPWTQLQSLILSKGFIEVGQVFNNPNTSGGEIPSECILFRLGAKGSVLLTVTKSWCSAANSTGRIKSQQCCQTGQAIDFCKNLADALEGKYSPSRVDHVGIEASIAKTWSDESVHRDGRVSAALSRQFALRGTANAFTSSGLSNHNIYLRQARYIDTGIHYTQFKWHLSCVFSKGKANLDDCVVNVASFCGTDYSRWKAALNHFRANEIVFTRLQCLLNEFYPLVGSIEPLTLVDHMVLVTGEKQEYLIRHRQSIVTICDIYTLLLP